MKLLIVGTGALATLFGATLSKSGVKITMLGTWKEGINALSERGAELDGEAFPVNATSNPKDCSGSTHAIVLVKSWQTERVAHQLQSCLTPEGVAITLQNGLGNDMVLANTLGEDRVTIGVTTIAARMMGPGKVKSGGEGLVTLKDEPRVAGLVSIFQKSGIPVNLVNDIKPIQWMKLAINAAINPLTALLQVPNGELLNLPSAKLLMDALAREVGRVAEALGVSIPTPGPEGIVEDVTSRTAINLSSMLQDVMRGNFTEIDAINGGVIKAAQKTGIPVPINQAIWQLVKNLK